MRRENLEFMTSVQALMHELDSNNWIYFFRKNRFNQMSHLFFSRESSQTILKANYEMLIEDCIYKINKYKMLLMIIFDQIALHKTVYLAFCFMTKEKQNDYVWIMKQLKSLYQQLKISQDSTIFVTDIKTELMNTLRLIFSSINHFLCIWHINNNVLINCKKIFVFKKAWNAFFIEWKTIMYAFSDWEYKHLWNQFVDRYNLSYDECIDYLYNIYIRDYRRRFIKCYIN
jgi:histone-lysine N-methyltransferase SETD2